MGEKKKVIGYPGAADAYPVKRLLLLLLLREYRCQSSYFLLFFFLLDGGGFRIGEMYVCSSIMRFLWVQSRF